MDIFSPDFLNTLLAIVGVLVIAVGALFLGKLKPFKKVPALDDVLKFAKVAVNAVEKLADNGKYAGLSTEERHKAKKADAVSFVKTALKEEFGVKMTPALEWMIDFAIEAVLKMMETEKK